MNLIEREQLVSTTEIFSDPTLNMRFYTAIELLAQIVMVMPRTATVASLAQATGKTPRLVRSILSTLSKDGLVARDAKEKDAWHCRSCNGIITLADIYRCFCLAEEKAVAKAAQAEADAAKGLATMDADNERSSEPERPSRPRSSNQHSVDLLMMQVKMTVNRAVFQQLEQFDLGRLRGLASTTSFRSHNARPRGYIPEPL
ncbi:Rrf2 family transcriptional regulator [Undibacterium sp. Jales W-56]|uniref:Rrf2 family transcriptional regulator n=1 Tax=Undibacterium sp. Jales W-56 TaxID=2897325 RepID=UPI0021D384AE|nr:Rrf2 family transcriptional regulator [Undibacterium sp. Jales W-56]MCU6432334.1 Rrf2 family transcriptional regulator [Undibacterium sp. Jales W-56]